jgi:CRISPR-associated endonuclease/helicase Cas3
LPVQRIASTDDAETRVVAAHRCGAAVAWIRNTVDDAIEAAAAIRAHGIPVELLHARFAMGDRLAIEHRVLAALGRGERPGRRGFVLIGTQILEQSLDYDVDVMVTDLAPIDLVIQRAGRLWRHPERKARPVDTPELLLLAPDYNAVTDAHWYDAVSKRAPAVYRHHGIVWRTARALHRARAIVTPDNVRALIEEVYGPDTLDDVPQPLHRASQDAQGAVFAAYSVANANLLDVARGYGGNNTNWGIDTATPTRLGDPVTTFRLGVVADGRIVPYCWAADRDARRSWALSEVSISQRKATGVPTPDAATEAMIARAKADWPEWEQEQPLLVLRGAGGRFIGSVIGRRGGQLDAHYVQDMGLTVDDASE